MMLAALEQEMVAERSVLPQYWAILVGQAEVEVFRGSRESVILPSRTLMVLKEYRLE